MYDGEPWSLKDILELIDDTKSEEEWQKTKNAELIGDRILTNEKAIEAILKQQCNKCESQVCKLIPNSCAYDMAINSLRREGKIKNKIDEGSRSTV